MHGIGLGIAALVRAQVIVQLYILLKGLAVSISVKVYLTVVTWNIQQVVDYAVAIEVVGIHIAVGSRTIAVIEERQVMMPSMPRQRTDNAMGTHIGAALHIG